MDSDFKYWWTLIPQNRSNPNNFLVQKAQAVQEHSSYKDKISGFCKNMILYHPSTTTSKKKKKRIKKLSKNYFCHSIFAIEELPVLGKPPCLPHRENDIAQLWANTRCPLWAGPGEGRPCREGCLCHSDVMVHPTAVGEDNFWTATLHAWWITSGFRNPREQCFFAKRTSSWWPKKYIVIIFPGNGDWDFNSFTVSLLAVPGFEWSRISKKIGKSIRDIL